MDRANREVSLTLLRYSMDKLESSHAEIRLSTLKKGDGKFQKSAYLKNQCPEFIYPLDVMLSGDNNVNANKPI